MPYELIICEKPKAAEKVALALADGKPIKKSESGVPHYLVTHGNTDIVVGCAVGHLFGLAQKEDKNWTYPSFDVEWKPTYEINKSSAFSKKYLMALKKLTKDAESFTIATDYDVEGEVIGLNVLRYACKQQDARRMKFSTLTKPDLLKAYDNAEDHIDWGQAKAGETRHKLDWYYGINLSRALTASIKKAGTFKVLSSGRVQGPALKIVVDRELEIQEFKPVPFWEIQLKGTIKSGNIEAWHEKDKIWEKKDADKIIDNTKDKDAKISSIKKNQFKQSPPTPFDLTTLQTESYRCFGIAPKDTLAIAQNLYIEGLISYPRTSSQKLPKEIEYDKIIEQLKKQNEYSKECDILLSKDKLTPNEGPKTDPAHPAIYPTGNSLNLQNAREQKLYDLIVRRFLAVFGEPAIRETVQIKIDVNNEIFIAKGTTTVEKNWHELYGKYVSYKEEEMPMVDEGEKVGIEEINQLDKETQPPKRYTPASIIKELEKKSLGTKATRASIVEALYDRDYIFEKSITATKLGISTVATLEKYSPRILDPELTRTFEDHMKQIQMGKEEPEDVLEKARTVLYDILMEFKEHELEVGKELIQAYHDTKQFENTVGKCPKCEEGKLMIIYSKKISKRFIVCNRNPDCRTIFQIPQTGKIKPLHKECKSCGYPLVQINRGKRPQQICLNPECETKKLENTEAEKELESLNSGNLEIKCPKCGKNLVVRKSIYGQFLGCSGFPKCRHTQKIDGNPNHPAKKEDDKKKAVKKTTTKKTATKKTASKASTEKKTSSKTVKKK